MAENESLTYHVGRNKVIVTARCKFYEVRVGDLKIVVPRPYSRIHNLSMLDFVFDGRPGNLFYAGCNLRCLRKGEWVDEEEAILTLLKLNGRNIRNLGTDEVARFESGLLTKRLANLRFGETLKRRTKTGALLTMSKCRGGLKVKTTNGLEFILGPWWMKVGELTYAVFVDSSKTRGQLAFLLRTSDEVTLVSEDGYARTIYKRRGYSFFPLSDLFAESIVEDINPAVKALLTPQPGAIQ
jgi:hypothetical protein